MSFLLHQIPPGTIRVDIRYRKMVVKYSSPAARIYFLVGVAIKLVEKLE